MTKVIVPLDINKDGRNYDSSLNITDPDHSLLMSIFGTPEKGVSRFFFSFSI